MRDALLAGLQGGGPSVAAADGRCGATAGPGEITPSMRRTTYCAALFGGGGVCEPEFFGVESGLHLAQDGVVDRASVAEPDDCGALVGE